LPILPSSRSSSRSLSWQPLESDRQGFDRRWYAHYLQEVFVPTSLDELTEALTQAIHRYGSGVKVVSGRHCYENFVYNDSTAAVLDLSGLNQVGYDHERQLFFVEAGCEYWSLYRILLNGYGKTLPAGSCYSVGAGGPISGGGYGLLLRLHGLTVDHLHAVAIAVWDPQRGEVRLLHVSAQSGDADERHLFWALCGAGGGNFGVIARYYFGTPEKVRSSAAQLVSVIESR
jgi:FAD/FMN-containing dehydrogenase